MHIYIYLYTKNPNQEWGKDVESAISSSISGTLPAKRDWPVCGGVRWDMCAQPWQESGANWAERQQRSHWGHPALCAPTHWTCGCFSPSPCPAHRREGCEEGKMEGVPDPGNLQLPPSLPGGTRGQHRLTQPTAGTGLRPAWPRDQRSMEVAGSHLRAPPPRLSLQRLLPSLTNPTRPLPPAEDQNASLPASFSHRVFVAEVCFQSRQSDKFFRALLGEPHGCVLGTFFLDEHKQGVLTPKDKWWGCEGGNHEKSQADPVQRHGMSCAQLSAGFLLAQLPPGGKEQGGTVCSMILEFKRSRGARESTEIGITALKMVYLSGKLVPWFGLQWVV